MGKNVQLSFFNISGTELLIDERTDDLYEAAKALYKDGFAVIVIDASNVPEALLGEVVEVLDFTYPEDEEEPLLFVSGCNAGIPLSSFRAVH